MNTSKKTAVFYVAIVLSMTATTVVSVGSNAFATSGGSDDPNRFGEEAEELAKAPDTDNEKGSEMGEHSRESDATPGEPGRLGIGNLPGHPSESIAGLCDDPDTPEQDDTCPGSIAD